MIFCRVLCLYRNILSIFIFSKILAYVLNWHWKLHFRSITKFHILVQKMFSMLILFCLVKKKNWKKEKRKLFCPIVMIKIFSFSVYLALSATSFLLAIKICSVVQGKLKNQNLPFKWGFHPSERWRGTKTILTLPSKFPWWRFCLFSLSEFIVPVESKTSFCT